MSQHGAAELLAFGISHKTAPVAVRERLALTTRDSARLVQELVARPSIHEAVAISTCNRTEVYVADSGSGDDPAARTRAELARLSGLRETALAPVLYAWEDEDAALHLFRVAAGLDSLVPGEAQIHGQDRDAVEAARAAGTAGPLLSRLFADALHAGKRVRSETEGRRLPPSVAAAAVELARREAGGLAGRVVLVVGAGRMASLVAAGLAPHGAEKVFVANHTAGRAEELARRFGGEVVHLSRLPDELARADVVVAATRCPRLVLTAEEAAPALRRRGGRPIVFVDIAVPRDLDPAIADLAGSRLFDIDDLGDALGESGAERRQELGDAEALLAEEAARFREWQLSLDVVPTITSLRRRAEEIRAGELARSEARLAALSPEERAAVELVTAQIVNKLLHAPTVRVKRAAAEPDGAAYAAALRDLFALDDGA